MPAGCVVAHPAGTSEKLEDVRAVREVDAVPHVTRQRVAVLVAVGGVGGDDPHVQLTAFQVVTVRGEVAHARLFELRHGRPLDMAVGVGCPYEHAVHLDARLERPAVVVGCERAGGVAVGLAVDFVGRLVLGLVADHDARIDLDRLELAGVVVERDPRCDVRRRNEVAGLQHLGVVPALEVLGVTVHGVVGDLFTDFLGRRFVGVEGVRGDQRDHVVVVLRHHVGGGRHRGARYEQGKQQCCAQQDRTSYVHEFSNALFARLKGKSL